MNENIITFNVTNLITIGIMGAIFFAVVRIVSTWLGSNQSA